MTQILLQTTALIVYGLAARERQDPDDVSPVAVHNWAAERVLPLPPHPDSPLTSTQWNDTLDDWRTDLDRAVERIRHDMAKLLRAAGHDIPDAGTRSLDRDSDDPVVRVWIDLADTDPPDTTGRYGVYEQYPAPRIALGVTTLANLHDDD